MINIRHLQVSDNGIEKSLFWIGVYDYTLFV